VEEIHTQRRRFEAALRRQAARGGLIGPEP